MEPFDQLEIARINPEPGEVFVIKSHRALTGDLVHGIQRAWEQAWDDAGIDAPSLVILPPYLEIGALSRPGEASLDRKVQNFAKSVQELSEDIARDLGENDEVGFGDR